ncbi:TPA: hypothetical protein SMN10_000192 [Proteus mirabilis]|nr:hypothetical protein [Proteus mirabilis]HDU8441701.1 hypothetical protein [Proteus mirabilis]HEJ9535841.1 hypothetical protein [Proteus mirabilis]HEK2674347.1 hypothetical protein [Proteus mirabilis]
MKIGLYSVTDKAIFDALNQNKITNEEMRGLFFRRGILISTQTPRKTLAIDFSKYYHGYKDFQNLSDILGSIGRREKSTNSFIKTNLNKDDIESCIKDTLNELNKEGDTTSYFITSNSFEITIKYVKLDYKLSEFRQSSTREANIQVEILNNNEYLLRCPPNPKAEEFTSILEEKIKEESEGDISTDIITLESVKSASERTRFFTKLIKEMKDHDLYDVSDVYISHPILNDLKGEDSELSNNDDESDNESDNESDIPDLGYHISKASLKGRGILDSEELKDLLDKEFYISRIIWTIKNKKLVDSDLIELEAQFIDSEKCKKFSYLIRGYYQYISINEFNKNRKSFNQENERELSKLLEKTARTISDKIIKDNSTSLKNN